MFRRFFLSIIVFSILLLGGEFFTTSCASRSAPGGGPRDSLAPVLDTAFPPNFTTNFTGKRITLIFDEYISLKSPSQQVHFSPPLEESPDIMHRGKEVEIVWTDTLLENTTYTITFGNAITDFTEGNINADFKYVFSTGDFIDSLSFRGRVVDSKTGTPVKEMLVALYDYQSLKAADSIPFRQLPTYYTYTTESGTFELTNLKYGSFHLLAFDDRRKNFKLNSGAEKIAFSSDTLILTDSTKSVDLVSFDPEPAPRYFGAKHSSKGKILIPFNYTVPGLQVETISTDSVPSFIDISSTGDTAIFWFDAPGRDSLVLLIKSDTAVIDTTTLFLREFGDPTLNLSLVNAEIKSDEEVELSSNLPLDSIDSSGFVFYYPEDTLPAASVKIVNPMSLKITPPRRHSEFSLYAKKGAVQSLLGAVNDSIMFQLESLRREDLGNLDFVVETDSTLPLVLIITSPGKKEIERRAFRGSTTVNLRNMRPGTYQVHLIIDNDENEKWSTGNYLQGNQPERILIYPDKAEIRANWDLELIWQPDISQETVPDIVNESRSDKN